MTGKWIIAKLISGGQTGVDRAALDVALKLGVPCGGWCPKGRRAEDGCIPARYPLRETPSPQYPQRTERNVREADATLILTRGRPDRGTALTRRLTQKHRKPRKVVNLVKPVFPEDVAAWLEERRINVLNVAGPRESSQPGIYLDATAFLQRLFGCLGARNSPAANA